jgi:hypothetical protein
LNGSSRPTAIIKFALVKTNGSLVLPLGFSKWQANGSNGRTKWRPISNRLIFQKLNYPVRIPRAGKPRPRITASRIITTSNPSVFLGPKGPSTGELK